MPTSKRRTRAYNLTPGQFVTIAGALHGKTKVAPIDWLVKDVTDHEGGAYFDISRTGSRLVTLPPRRTLTLRPAGGGRTYLITVDRDSHVTLVDA